MDAVQQPTQSSLPQRETAEHETITTYQNHTKTIRRLSFIVLLALAILISLGYGFTQYYFNQSKHSSNQLPQAKKPIPIPSTTPYASATWNIYTASNSAFSFKYPPNWYSTTDPFTNPQTDVSLFFNGVPPDFSEGDHKGNEIVIISQILSPLQRLKNERYSNVPISQLATRDALRVSDMQVVIALSNTSSLNIQLVDQTQINNFNQILNTIRFTQPIEANQNERNENK